MSRSESYTYRAARRDGAIEFGKLDARGREEVLAYLARQGLFPIELRLEGGSEERRGRLSTSDLALGLRVLAGLLESGLPIARSLHALDDLVPPSWRRALPAIRESVREGKSLAAALEGAPLDIPSVIVGMIRAGEAGSGVAPAVRRAADLMESAAARRRAIRGALAYPLILSGAGAASLALMVGIVLPRFEAILFDLGQSLPQATHIVLSAAAAFRAAALPAAAALVVIGLVWRAWTETDAGRRRWHHFLLTLPIIGGVRRSSGAAHVSATLAALLESRVPLSPALLHAARASGDAALVSRLLAAREAVIVGSSLASALEAEGALTPTAVRLVRAGEEMGQLATMLGHAARLESERAEQVVRASVRLLEPALIVIFGGLVAVVAAALLQAVYSVRPTP
jgi:general secretion pathway protein F